MLTAPGTIKGDRAKREDPGLMSLLKGRGISLLRGQGSASRLTLPDSSCRASCWGHASLRYLCSLNTHGWWGNTSQATDGQQGCSFGCGSTKPPGAPIPPEPHPAKPAWLSHPESPEEEQTDRRLQLFPRRILLYPSFPSRGIAVLIKLSVSLAAQGGRSCGQASPPRSTSDPLALDTLSPPPIYKSKS